MSPTVEFPSDPAPAQTALARLSFAFLRDEMTLGMAGLEPLDALLVMAINQANIAPLTRDPDARARYGQLDAPAPDGERRPVSINAIAGSLGLPFETARRRIRNLSAAGVCATSRDGVVVPATFLASPAYLQSVMSGHERLRGFFGELKAAGLVGQLPAPNYRLEGSVPVRAAARLLSDYILRTSEGLMREGGNVISVLALAALLAAALAADDAAAPQPITTLAAQISLPPETVRRHAAQLETLGLCAKTRAGVLMPPEALERPGLRQLLDDNAIHIQRLLSGLAERGVILAWETGGALDGRQMA